MRVKPEFVACLLVLGLAAPVQAQSISEALTMAYNNAPDLQAALLSAKSSAEGIAQAQAGMRPTIGASLSGNQNWALTGGNFTSSSALTTGLTYNQTIFDNHRTDARIAAAQAGAELAEHQIRNTEQTVLLGVIQAYMAVVTDRQLVTLRGNNVEFFRAQLASAQDRLTVGEGTRIDVAQAEARLAQGQATYRAAQSSLEVSEASFARYVGTRPQALNNAHGYAALVPRSLDSALAEAEVGHPAILMAKASIRVAQATMDGAEAAFGPTASLTGSVGSRWTGPYGGVSDGFTGALGFQISVPIYSGGAIGSSVRKANLDQVKSEVDAMSAYDKVREAVISAWAGIQSADAQILAATAAVAAGREVLDGVMQERELGTRTTLDVLNAQAELTSANEGQINATSNKVVATFSLLSAMGRLTASDLGLAVEIKSAAGYRSEVEDVWQELRAVQR